MNSGTISRTRPARIARLAAIVGALSFSLAPTVLALPALAAAPSVASVHQRLMEWLTLTGPEGTHLPAARYQAFLLLKPAWPERPRIFWRYQNALATTADPRTLRQLCPTLTLTLPNAFLACAPYLTNAADLARALWISGTNTTQEEDAFLSAYGSSFTSQDQWARFERLDAAGLSAAGRRQIGRLPADRQPLATAQLAQKTDAPEADALFAALPAQDQTDPTLIRARITLLRHANRLDDAVSLWNSIAATSQAAAPSPEWSRVRGALARSLLLGGRAKEALPLADDQTLPPESPERQDAAFLTGFIALRSFNDSSRALEVFAPLTTASPLTVRARGLYWSARAADAAGNTDDAHRFIGQAAAYPTTLYGQLALARQANIADVLTQDAPSFTPLLRTALTATRTPHETSLLRPDLMLAATELSGLGDIDNARLFLMMMQAESQTDGEQKALADLAMQLGVAEPAVFAARSLNRRGAVLYPQGYPVLEQDVPESALPAGLLAAVVRQESSFDPHAQSPAHAIGLLQLLPAAARDVVRREGLGRLNVSAAALENPRVNLRVGSAYVRELLDRFSGNVPLALAAYNAGPHRVDLWLQEQPLPAPLTQDDLLDWIERLPYRETRLYIAHILADTQIYRTLQSHG